MKLKLSRNVHNNSLYKKVSFLLLLLMCFHCYDNLKFPLTYNGKSKSRPLLLTHCRYFDKSFTEMILEQSSTKHMNFVQTASTKSMFFYCHCSCAKFSLTYDEKSESKSLWLSHCRYFDRTFLEMFVE